LCTTGYDQGVLSGLLSSARVKNQFQLTATVNGQPIQKAAKVANIVSVYNVGCLLGAALIFFKGEALGRRMSMLIGTSILIAGTALQASAFGMPQMIIGRIISGFGNGINSATIPVYNSEISSPKHRGRDLAIGQTTLMGGIWISYLVGTTRFVIPFINETTNILCYVSLGVQRLPIAFQAVFAVILIIMLIDLPESPRWLLAQGRISEARTIFAHLTSHSTKPTDDIVVAQSHKIQDAMELERGFSVDFKYMELFEGKNTQNFRRVCLCFGIQLMQQVITSTTLIYKAIGMSDNTLRIFLGVGGVGKYYIDKMGRRRSMISSALGCSASMAALGVLLSIGVTGSKGMGWAAAATSTLFNNFFTIGWLAIPWLVICTLRLRSKGAAIATISYWLFNLIIVQVTPVMMRKLEWKTYIMFAVFNASFAPVVYLFYPETALKSLESIDRIFSSPDKNRFGTGEDLRLGDQPQVVEIHVNGDFEGKDKEKPEGVVLV
ncbi:general substrate transporter, partial [Gautieria morchelliformis]